MSDPGAEPRRAPRASRLARGRMLGGVCAGIAAARGLRAAWVRLAFLLATACGGLGAIAYLACWLILPVDGSGERDGGPSGLVALAWSTAGVIALAALAAMSAAITVFGGGWIAFGLGSIALLATLVPRLRIATSWALPAVAALTLPAVAVALSPVRLTLQSGQSALALATARQISAHPYRTGFGTLLLDLRHTSLPSRGVVALRIDAGVRRTIVALPAGRCVRVTVKYDVHPFARQLAALLSGEAPPTVYGVVLFGAWHGTFLPHGTRGAVASPARRPGPTLAIDFSSQGGSLYVRDYPDDVSPQASPNWPGFHVTPEPRPNLSGEPKRAIPGILSSWQQRLRVEEASARAVNPLIPGPCDPPAALARSDAHRSLRRGSRR